MIQRIRFYLKPWKILETFLLSIKHLINHLHLNTLYGDICSFLFPELQLDTKAAVCDSLKHLI